MSSKLTRRSFVCGASLLACVAVVSSTAGAAVTSQKETKHIVQKGDSVWQIAAKWGVDPAEIIEINKLKKPYLIFPGQVLIIPRAVPSRSGTPERPSGTLPRHIVQKGDTVWGIARKYGVQASEIIRANKLKKPYLIFPGQALVIPGLVSTREREREIARLCRLPRGVRRRKWRYIVIHHSGTTIGSAAIFDRYHRRRGMKNGLAYHFVIGNGKGSRDGQVEVGGRWTKQLQGGHCRNHKMNDVGIGICLVGDFQKRYPTRKQMESLVFLVRYLMRNYSIPKRRVIGHRDVRGSPTDCPGKNFSLVQFRRRL